jgi:opacity protein-like surface antigen
MKDTTMLKKLVLGVAALALAAPGAALAQDYYSSNWQHQEDHHEHQGYHQQTQGQHALAHDLGLFQSEEQHDTYHEAVQDQHNEFHEDHPGTRHDHRRSNYGYRSYGSGGYVGYNSNYGYRTPRSYYTPQRNYSYGYSPY